jgi:hypothetical protein
VKSWGGPGDPGRASYQVVVTQCEDCGRGFQHANGGLIELDPAIVEMSTIWTCARRVAGMSQTIW